MGQISSEFICPSLSYPPPPPSYYQMKPDRAQIHWLSMHSLGKYWGLLTLQLVCFGTLGDRAENMTQSSTLWTFTGKSSGNGGTSRLRGK